MSRKTPEPDIRRFYGLPDPYGTSPAEGHPHLPVGPYGCIIMAAEYN